jgi:putative flippase GtrA
MQLVAQPSGSSAALRIGYAPQSFVRRLARLMPQLSRYGVVSVGALAADFSVYIALFSAAVAASLAGVAGYAVGMVVHYFLSSRFVFKTQGSRKSERRRFVEFLLSGLVGITLTGFIIAIATGAFGVAPIAAKIVAASVSFAAVFAIRRSVVFAA